MLLLSFFISKYILLHLLHHLPLYLGKKKDDCFYFLLHCVSRFNEKEIREKKD